MYPITLKLEGKPCVVAGGGKIAFHKIGPLLEAKAVVTVVSPEIIPEIENLYLEGKINVLKKEIQDDDYQKAFLVIAATNSPEVNAEIYEKTKNTKLINVSTDAERGNFHIPATYTCGRLQISVATGGASPLLAKKIRDELKEQYDDSYEDYLEFLYEVRMKIKLSLLSKEEKQELYKEAIEDKYKHSIEERNQFLMHLTPF
jgi:precorrin-2 dehydrogenase / sirohydrochlorin ferrochelatase